MYEDIDGNGKNSLAAGLITREANMTRDPQMFSYYAKWIIIFQFYLLF